MTEVEVAGHTYRIGMMNAMMQFHVGRRLAPAVITLGDVFSGNPLPLAEALQRMSDADSEYIINSCLAVVERKSGNGAASWAKLRASNGSFMFDDIDAMVMVSLTIAVIKDKLGNFSVQGVLGQSPPTEPQQPQT
jgi:hypothetical protein